MVNLTDNIRWYIRNKVAIPICGQVDVYVYFQVNNEIRIQIMDRALVWNPVWNQMKDKLK